MSGRKIAGAAAIVSAITMLSRILGYIRDAISAALFGVGLISDAYFVAFRIPNLLRDLLAEGALSSAFVPVFTDYIENKSDKEVWRLVNNVLTVLAIILTLIVLLGLIIAPVIVMIIAPGFTKDPAKFALTTKLTRILFPFLMLVSIAAIFLGILNSFKKFSIPAFAPVVLNIGWIFFGLFVCPKLPEGKQIYGWAAGALTGALLQIILQFIPAFKLGFKWKFIIDLKEAGLRRIGKLMVPATLGQSITQLSLIINTMIASFLAAGSVTYLYYGNRLMQLPLGVFGVAIATVSFPFISTYVAQKDYKSLRETIHSSLKQAFFIVLPASAGIIFLSREINTLLFYYGKFTYHDVLNTAKVSIMYSIAIFAYSGNKILTPVFYALDKAHQAVKIGLLSLVINVILNIALAFPLGFLGLALGTAISGIINFTMLYGMIIHQIGDIDTKGLVKFALKILGASLIMGLIIFGLAHYMEMLLSAGMSRMKNGIVVLAAIIAGTLLYYLLLKVFRVEEGDRFLKMIEERIKRK
jgi:putative peptidoglycan lipid II flippase